MLGYAAFSWLRTKRAARARSAAATRAQPPVLQLLSSQLEHVGDELALDTESERLPANNNAQPRSAVLGALFLGRASEALSPFEFSGKF